MNCISLIHDIFPAIWSKVRNSPLNNWFNRVVHAKKLQFRQSSFVFYIVDCASANLFTNWLQLLYSKYQMPKKKKDWSVISLVVYGGKRRDIKAPSTKQLRTRLIKIRIKSLYFCLLNQQTCYVRSGSLLQLPQI